MYRIRFHGRGGQGMKTASRILGTAFFLEGYEAQDAPRYGVERRGAPIFAYVRADEHPILERGIIREPDLIIVADETLVGVPAAGVLAGVTDHAVILIYTNESEQEWRHRLNIRCRIITLPVTEAGEHLQQSYTGAVCAGAAACLSGVIGRETIRRAIELELASMPQQVIDENLREALAAYEAMADHSGVIQEGTPGSAESYREPNWIDMPFDEARVAAPVIFNAANSVEVRTGLWRVLRPIIEYDKCKHCWWICSTFCPDSAIKVSDGKPAIDYDHCKGCMICVAQCPSHAIQALPEQEVQELEGNLT